MGSICAFIFCALLVQIEGNAVQRQPAVSPTPFALPIPTAPPVQAVPIAEPTVAPLPTNVRQARFTNGTSMLPRHNQAVVSAPEKGMLMSLTTERRDAAGNIVRDSDGNPIIVPIARGMNVFQGQVLGKLDDRELHSILKINQAQLEVAKAERDKKLEIIYAAHGVQLAINELQRMLVANRQMSNTFSEQDVQRAELARIHAEVNLELQKYIIDEVKTKEVIVRESELDRTEVQIGLRQLVSQIDGMIVQINAAEGEWLREGQEVLGIVRLDTLWVRVQANVSEYTTGDLDGKQAAVRVAFPDGRMEVFQGVVVFCNPTVEVPGSVFEVYIEVQNRRDGNFWLLQPGRMGLDVIIQL